MVSENFPRIIRFLCNEPFFEPNPKTHIVRTGEMSIPPVSQKSHVLQIENFRGLEKRPVVVEKAEDVRYQ